MRVTNHTIEETLAQLSTFQLDITMKRRNATPPNSNTYTRECDEPWKDHCVLARERVVTVV